MFANTKNTVASTIIESKANACGAGNHSVAAGAAEAP